VLADVNADANVDVFLSLEPEEFGAKQVAGAAEWSTSM
jgi:hypothetical protein